MTKFLLLVVVALGCAPSWDGRFVGSAKQTTACVTGGSALATIQLDWTIQDQGTELVVATGEVCSGLEAKPDGTSALLSANLCGPYPVASNATETVRTIQGTLDLAPHGLLDVAFLNEVLLGGQLSGTCYRSVTGQLSRLR